MELLACVFIVDLTKIMVFISLASASIYLLNNYASYIWLNLFFTTFSSFFFIYSISFVFDKEESGQKAIISFLMFIIIIVLVMIITIMVSLELEFDFSFLLNKYNFTFLDLSPITSFMLSFSELLLVFISLKRCISQKI